MRLRGYEDVFDDITIIIEITNHKTYLTEKISCRFRSRTLQEYKHENSSSE